jgi:hypothetical protein
MAKPATAQQLADLTQQQQAAEAAALEGQTVQEADGGAGVALAALIGAALAAWVLAFGAVAATGAGTALAAYLVRMRRDVQRAQSGLDRRAARAIEGALDGAAAMGARHAVDFASRASGRQMVVPDVTVPRDARQAARGVADAVAEQLRVAARLLHPRTASSWHDVLAGLGAARRAVSIVGSTVAWCLYRAINDGAAQAIAAIGARALWVAEPDACVICLAYAGRFADRDSVFPGGLSMDPASHSTSKAAIEGPPVHPNCRCRLVPWRDEWAYGPTSLPELLRSQAVRSIATGSRRPSESRAARMRAARALAAQRQIPDPLRRAAQATAAGRF